MAGSTATGATKPVDSGTRTALKAVRSVLTVAATVVAEAAGETAVTTAVWDAQLEECSMGGVAAADVVANGAYVAHPYQGATIVPAEAVVISREEALGGSPVEMLVASAKAEAAEAKAAMAQQIAAPAITTEVTVFGSSAVIPDRAAPGDTVDTTAACNGVLLVAASGLLATAEAAEALARQ